MHILVTGGTGLIGKAATAALHKDGHDVTVLSRRKRVPTDEAKFVTALTDCVEPVDAVINLAGAGLADRRWSAAYKAEIISSRIDLTRVDLTRVDLAGVFDLVLARWTLVEARQPVRDMVEIL